MDKNTSGAFSFLRFPLAVLVIYLHIDVVPDATLLSEIDFSTDEGKYLYYLCAYSVCLIARCAVPCFFFISGFLFLNNSIPLTEQGYLYKLKRRFFTLLVPYILWNLLAALYLHFIVRQHMSLSYILWNPADFPLWFIRNLILLNIATPFFYWILKYGRKWSILILLFLYLFQYKVPGSDEFTAQSIFFYFLGMAVCYFNLNIKDIPAIVKWAVFALSCVLFIMLTSDWTIDHILLRSIFILSGSITILFAASALVRKGWAKSVPLLAASTFFIYAIHRVGPTFIAKSALEVFIPEGYYGRLIIFLVAPILTAVICIGLYWLMKKLCPKLLYILVGRK